MCRIKNEKEQLREAEEKEMERQRQQEEERKDMAEREYLILERLMLDEEEAAEKVERREKTKSIKESKRYVLPICGTSYLVMSMFILTINTPYHLLLHIQ